MANNDICQAEITYEPADHTELTLGCGLTETNHGFCHRAHHTSGGVTARFSWSGTFVSKPPLNSKLVKK